MNINSIVEKALSARKGRASAKTAWVGFAVASLIAAVSVGGWIVLVLQSL